MIQIEYFRQSFVRGGIETGDMKCCALVFDEQQSGFGELDGTFAPWQGNPAGSVGNDLKLIASPVPYGLGIPIVAQNAERVYARRRDLRRSGAW